MEIKYKIGDRVRVITLTDVDGRKLGGQVGATHTITEKSANSVINGDFWWVMESGLNLPESCLELNEQSYQIY